MVIKYQEPNLLLIMSNKKNPSDFSKNRKPKSVNQAQLVT